MSNEIYLLNKRVKVAQAILRYYMAKIKAVELGRQKSFRRSKLAILKDDDISTLFDFDKLLTLAVKEELRNCAYIINSSLTGTESRESRAGESVVVLFDTYSQRMTISKLLHSHSNLPEKFLKLNLVRYSNNTKVSFYVNADSTREIYVNLQEWLLKVKNTEALIARITKDFEKENNGYNYAGMTNVKRVEFLGIGTENVTMESVLDSACTFAEATGDKLKITDAKILDNVSQTHSYRQSILNNYVRDIIKPRRDNAN